MKKLSIIPFILMSLVAIPSWSETLNDLVQRDGIYYEKFSDVPFTGEIKGLDRGKLKDGKFQGSWVHYHENGQLWMKGEYNGLQEGLWVSYWENGQLYSRGHYKNGRKYGQWVFYNDLGSPDKEESGIYVEGRKISD